MWGYIFDGTHIKKIELGRVEWNRKANRYDGKEVVDRFLGKDAVLGDKAEIVISAKELAERYGITVQPEEKSTTVKK